MKIAIGLLAAAMAMAQGPNQGMIQDTQTLPLWKGMAPGQVGTEDKDIPTITVYLPRSAAKGLASVIVCPGGGYGGLAMNHEGRQVANYLNSLGMAAFVLKYRLGPKYHHPIELGDAQRAIRMVRSHAAEWGLAADKIGILGFSAGGHLASSASTHMDAVQSDPSDPVDQVSSRPDFAVLGYPVISLLQPWTSKGSLKNLLGDKPDPALVKSLSSEEQITEKTPPTFLFHTNGDTSVPAENSIYYFLALRKNKVPAEMHIFEKGPHGVGLANNDAALGEWSKLLANWFRTRGIL